MCSHCEQQLQRRSETSHSSTSDTAHEFRRLNVSEPASAEFLEPGAVVAADEEPENLDTDPMRGNP